MILRWSPPLKAYTGTCFGPNRDHSGSEACSKSQSFHCHQGRALSIELLWNYKLLCRRLTSEFGLNRLHISLILLLTICKCDISAQGYFTICSTNCMSWQFIEYVFSWWWRPPVFHFAFILYVIYQLRSDNVFDWSWCAQLIILCRRRVKRLFMF